ncbi:MAG: replicative DNA helicase, partial [Lachnospiraceae bacterium]
MESNIQVSQKEMDSESITISQKAEQSVLGSILISNDAITEISSILDSEDFYYTAHKTIYSVMLELFKESIPIDLLTLTEKIRSIANLEDVGGYSYIAKLPSTTDYTQNVESYAKIVKEKSKLRQIVSACNKIIGEANSGKTVDEVLEMS